MHPAVCIVLLNWNGKQDTIACIESLKKISYDNAKIVVVDNASTDGSVESIPSLYPDIEFISLDNNRLYAGGNNAAFEKFWDKDYPYFLILNNDTTVEPEFIEPLVERLEKYPKIGIAGPKILYYDHPEMIWSAGGRINFWRGKIFHRGIRQFDGPKWNQATQVDYLSGCCFLIHRDLLKTLNGFDESYYIYTEDTDLCLRAAKLGYSIFYEPRSVMYHKVSSSSGGGLTPFKIYHRIRSTHLFFRRHAKGIHWLCIPFSIALEVIPFTISLILKGNRSQVLSLIKGFFSLLKKKKKYA